MNSQLPPVPEPAVNNWQTASLEELREETANLRRFVASLFLQVKEWTGRMNDLAQTSEQAIALKGDDESKYIALSNKTAELDENITLIMQALGLDEEEDTNDN